MLEQILDMFENLMETFYLKESAPETVKDVSIGSGAKRF